MNPEEKNRSLENLPPTQDALAQHVKQTVVQSSIWAFVIRPSMHNPKTKGMGMDKGRKQMDTSMDDFV